MMTANQVLTGDDVRMIVREEIGILRDEMREHYATKADLSELKIDLIKWMVGLMMGSATLATGLAVLIQRLVG